MMLADFAELDNGGFSFTFPDGFDLAETTAQEISDDLAGLGYFINKSTVSGQTITVRLSGTTALGGMVTPPPDSVRVTLVLADVVNPTLAAVYRLGPRLRIPLLGLARPWRGADPWSAQLSVVAGLSGRPG